MAFLWTARVAVLSAVLVFAIINLGLSADFIHEFSEDDATSPSFAGLGVAVSVLTLITLGPMLVIDLLRRSAVTSWIMVELAITSVLCILWLAAAADTTNATDGVTLDCSEVIGVEETVCREYQAMQAFEFLNWIFLLFYSISLLVSAIVAHNRGNSVWRSTVRDAEWGSRSADPAVPMTQAHAHV